MMHIHEWMLYAGAHWKWWLFEAFVVWGIMAKKQKKEDEW